MTSSPLTPHVTQRDIDTMLQLDISRAYVEHLLRQTGVDLSLPPPDPKTVSPSGGLSPEEIEIFKKGGAVFDTGRSATAKARAATILDNLAKDCRLVVDDSLGVEEVAKLLNISHMDAEKRASRNPPELYAFTFEGSLRFPGWQFDGSTTIPHLRSLLASTVGTINPVGLTRFMLHDNIDLEVNEKLTSPRDWLVRGENADPLLMIVRDL